MEHRELPGSPGRTGAASPAAGARGGGAHPTALKRKLTLLALIDELSALKEDDTSLQGYGNEEKREKDAFVQTEVYEDPSFKEGAAAFERFDKSVNTLIQGLFAFQTAARQLGSSVGLLASASELCERLHKIELIFHENAAVLFPQIKSKVLDIEPPKTKRRRPENRGRSNSLFVRPAAITASPDPETLPEELLGLAKGIKAFLVHLEEFPEFVDEALNASITAFERDLTYRADCLEEYEDQFRWPSVQRYVHAISTEMTEHVQMITRALKDFVDNGVPAIRFAQQNNAENLLFLSTIATFFSGVTATAAQYSYASTSRTIDDMVNLLFFGSLILSISAAINSLLGLTWKRAMYRSPRHRVPWWVLIWTKRSPLVFMVVSVALFSAGLVCFCYATQTIFVAITILILTTFCTFGLVAVSAWFLAERYIYSKHNGLRWLSDVLHDHRTRFIKHPPIQFIRYIPRRIRDGLRRLKHNLCRGDKESSELEDGLPFPNGVDDREKATPSPVSYRHPRISGSMDKGVGITESPVASLNPINRPETPVPPTPMSPTPMMQSPARHFSFATASVAASAAAASNSPTTATEGILVNGPKLKGANLFRQLAWKVAAESTQNGTTATSPTRGMSIARSMTVLSDPGRRRDTDEGSHHLKAGRISALRPSLKKLRVTNTIWDHTALVRHLQFSPNGKVLATCGWDGTTRLFDVPTTAGEPVGQRNVMAVAGKSLGTVMFWGQAAWSPDGRWLLTKWMTGIQVWTESGVRKATIARGKLVRSVAWLPSSEAFLSVEGSQVVEMSVDGIVRETHELKRLDLQDVAVTPDEERMLGVANLLSTKSGFHPSLSRAEKRIVVYNLKDKKIENLVPVLDEVRDITISRNGQFALVSSEGKGPPQLFRMDKIKVKDNKHEDDDDEIDEVVRLVPVRTYLPKTEVDFAGASYFAGQEDEFILVPTKSGDILFWDQDSGRLLHALRNKDVGDGDLTSVAWNYASKRHMLASACHDGSVRIWTSSAPERDGTRGKERDNASVASHPYGLDHDMELSVSPMSVSRRPTNTDGASHTHGEPSTYVTGRASMEGSTEGAGPSFIDPTDKRERRRVESPTPAELPGDNATDSTLFFKKTGNKTYHAGLKTWACRLLVNPFFNLQGLCKGPCFETGVETVQVVATGSTSAETVKVPQMAESITEGTLKQWTKQVGDHVEQDEEVATIETDKIDVSVNAPKAGTITEHLAKEEDTVTVGQDLFKMEAGEGGGSSSAASAPKEEKEESAPPPKKEEDLHPAPDAKEDVKASEPTTAPPPKQAQTPAPPQQKPKEEKSSSAPPPPPAAPGSRNETRVKMNRMRLRIAERLKESQNSAASLTTFNEIDMSSLMEMRKLYKDEVLKTHEVKLGFMSAFAKACVLALKEIPAANASIEGDSIVYRDYVDLSVAVATPKGLVTPVVRNAEGMNFVGIEKEIAALGKKARDGKLTIEDMAGGTFTISNGGVFGSLYGTPIINLPQAAVLGMHTIKERPVVVNGQIVIRPIMVVALTYDHRLLDGREAVTFLVRVKEYIEDPRKMLLA